MTHSIHTGPAARPFRRAAIPAFVAAFGLGGAAQAFQFDLVNGQVQGSLDTTVSLGAQMRVEDPDASLISQANGGQSRATNEDDGNQNYESGDITSAQIKASQDLDLSYRNYGVFARALYFYDYAVEHKDALDDYPEADDRIGAGVRMLDLFARGQWRVGDVRLTGRFGNQVLSWGESTFIQNGINVINPLDVARLRTPGAEVKEGLLPTVMAHAMAEYGNTSVEAFYQFSWDEYQLDPAGTYFSTTDILSPGGDKAWASYGRRLDNNSDPLPYLGITSTGGLAPVSVAGYYGGQLWLPRDFDRGIPQTSGQFGVAVHQFFDSMGGAEVGAYYLNYHSRTPFFSTVRGSPSFYVQAGPEVIALENDARYFADYPEDIHLFGLSLNATGPWGTALQAEYSFRPNQPLQISGGDVYQAALGLQNSVTGDAASASAVPVGTEIHGYDRVDMHQVQATATKAFARVAGASQLVALGEIGYTRLSLDDDQYFSAPGVALPSAAADLGSSLGSSQDPDGYMKENSWGYRLVLRADYPNAMGPVNLTPRFAWSHDVEGTSPTFNEDTKAATAGLTFSYRQQWDLDISYTNFFGGRTWDGEDPGWDTPDPLTGGATTVGDAYESLGQTQYYATSSNPIRDRDFVAVSLSYSF